jgi:c-di-GMP-binding flagellar brake protein YcgR
MENSNKVENREFLRAGISVFINEGYSKDSQLAHATDISESGMRYYKPIGRELRRGRYVRLEFCLPGDDVPIKARGCIVYDGFTSTEQDTGIVFTKLKIRDRVRIHKYVLSRKRAELFEHLYEMHLADNSASV